MPIINMVYKKKWKWKPWANTLLYLPLESDTNDYSGNNRTTSASNISFTTVGWVPSAHVGSTGWISVSPDTFITHDTPYKTNSVLIYVTSQTTSSNRYIFEWAKQNAYHFWWLLVGNSSNFEFGSNSTWANTYSWITANSWIHLVHTIWDWQIKLYINWALVNTQTYSTWYPWGNWSNSFQQSQTIFNTRNGVWQSQALNWNARELIFEQALWSADDVSNYYNWIKWKLGF